MDARYQKHTRLATSAFIQAGSWSARRFPTFLLAIISLLFCAVPKGFAASPSAASHVAVSTLALQATGKTTGHYVIQSPQLPGLALVTHTVDMRLQPGVQIGSAAGLSIDQLAPEQLTLIVNSTYRFHNVDEEAKSVRLVLLSAPTSGNATRFAAPQSLGAQLDSVPLNLQTDATGNQFFDLTISPDQRRVVSLSYQTFLGDSALPEILYPVDWLDAWVSFGSVANMSYRFTIGLPDGFSTDSRLAISPEEWTFALSNNIQQPDVKWLYDAEVPSKPIQFRFVHPLLWQGLQEENQATVTDGSPASYLSLGNRYRDLYTAARSASSGITSIGVQTSAATTETFYARAVAAYNEGIQAALQTGDTSSAVALLHTQLASLYRNRILDGGNRADDYAELTTQTVAAALDRLPAESTLRPELQRWQIEGLYSLLQQAQQSRQWDLSLDYIDQLVPLVDDANPVINRTRLEENRRVVIVQEALDLLEAGNKNAAISLAGAEIASQELQPAIEEQSLFTRWQITTTISAERRQLAIAALTDTQRLSRAQDSLTSLINRLQQANLIQIENPVEVVQRSSIAPPLAVVADDGENASAAQDVERTAIADQSMAVLTTISFGSEQPAETLLQLIADEANWALLRALIRNLNAQGEANNTLLMDQQSLKLAVDLRSAGDHWSTMVAKLRRNADQASAASNGSTLPSDINAARANAQLASRIQSVNFANEAEVWQDLIEKSWVLVQLTANAPQSTVERVWVMNVNSPPQLLQIEASGLATTRITTILMSILAALLLITGLLWWLL